MPTCGPNTVFSLIESVIGSTDMWTRIGPVVVLLLVLCKFDLSFGDDFPSLISTNASIGICLQS